MGNDLSCVHSGPTAEPALNNEAVRLLARENLEAGEAAVLLSRASDLIEARGWTQHDYSAADGRMCVIGALYTADLPAEMLDAHDTAMAALGIVAKVDPDLTLHRAVVRWNDAPTRTKQQILDALTEAEKHLRNLP